MKYFWLIIVTMIALAIAFASTTTLMHLLNYPSTIFFFINLILLVTVWYLVIKGVIWMWRKVLEQPLK